MNKLFLIVFIGAILFGGILFLGGKDQKIKNENVSQTNNVKLENGFQIIEIKAKGGYLPRTSVAQAGLPTILRFNTNGTFDCSSSVRIPSFNISQSLPISGFTDIELPSSNLGTLKGTCGMGMYPFEVVFNDFASK